MTSEANSKMAIKPPEEGRIWEWRAFGVINAGLLSTVRALPIRNGLVNHPDEDIYLISPVSDQNVKFRKLGSRWVLKFKELIEKGPDSVELYQEGMETVWDLPVPPEVLASAATLLKAALPAPPAAVAEYGRLEIIDILARAVPQVLAFDVPKVRTQYIVDGGWVELADVGFPRVALQTISIHSFNRRVVEQTLEFLEPTAGLDVMNYVDACRRWGSASQEAALRPNGLK